MTSPAKKMMQVLEIHLISAQGLKPPSNPRRRLQTYALTWIDSATKLRTRVDQVGGHNPTWNDKFLFRVTPEFLASETSGVSVAIYAIGTFKDHLVGTVRFLISNILSSAADADAARAPCFSAVQIRQPSGSFLGVMNVGAMVIEASDFPALDKIPAIGYRDLMGMKTQKRRKKKKAAAPPESESKHAAGVTADGFSSDSCDHSFGESVEEAESSTTSSSSSSPKIAGEAALKEWNGVRELAGNKGLAGSGFLCCLVARRSIQPLTPTHPAMER